MKKLVYKIYDKVTSFYMMVGIIPAIAIYNVVDVETWKRGIVSVVLGLVALVITLPLLPFLAVGVLATYLGDRYRYGSEDGKDL